MVLAYTKAQIDLFKATTDAAQASLSASLLKLQPAPTTPAGYVQTSDGAGGTLFSAPLAGYTDEQAQDTIAAMITAGTKIGITISYDDINNRLNFTVPQAFTKSTVAPTNPAVNDLWVDLS